MVKLLLLNIGAIASKAFTEKEIIDGVDKNKTEVYQYLYKKLTPVIYYDIKINSGTQEDAEDHFQDTMIVVAANVKGGKYVEGNFEAYFKRVSKNLWLKKLRDGSKMKQTEYDDSFNKADEYDDEFVENMIRYDTVIDLVNEKLNELDENCHKVITMFYHHKISLGEIAEKFSWEYSYAKKKVFLCRKKLKEMVQADEKFSL